MRRYLLVKCYLGFGGLGWCDPDGCGSHPLRGCMPIPVVFGLNAHSVMVASLLINSSSLAQQSVLVPHASASSCSRHGDLGDVLQDIANVFSRPDLHRKSLSSNKKSSVGKSVGISVYSKGTKRPGAVDCIAHGNNLCLLQRLMRHVSTPGAWTSLMMICSGSKSKWR